MTSHSHYPTIGSDTVIAPSPQYALIGSTIELQCSIEGLVTIVTWAPTGTNNFIIESVIPSVTWANESMYTCKLRASGMEDITRDVELIISGELMIKKL